MDSEDFWNKSRWTLRAREILDAIKVFPENSKIILVLRHSHRNEPSKMEDLSKLRLTELGHKASKRFGERIPLDRSIRLFHSIMARCQETAEGILEGFRKKSGIGDINGVLEPLYYVRTAPNFFIELFKKTLPLKFLYQWFAGHYSPDIIIPFQEYSKQAANIIWNEIKNAPENSIDIHVTHDIFIMALRFGWFGLPPKKRWVPFLGGFAFLIQDNTIMLFDNNNFIEIDTPYWWKSMS